MDKCDVGLVVMAIVIAPHATEMEAIIFGVAVFLIGLILSIFTKD